MFLVGRRLERIKELKGGLHVEFKMRDSGEAKFLLGKTIFILNGYPVF